MTTRQLRLHDPGASAAASSESRCGVAGALGGNKFGVLVFKADGGDCWPGEFSFFSPFEARSFFVSGFTSFDTSIGDISTECFRPLAP